MRITSLRRWLALAALGCLPAADRALAQEPVMQAVIVGRVVDAASGAPVPGVRVHVEGTNLAAVTDEEGRFRLAGVPPGPQVLGTRRLGFAPTRVPVTVPPSGTLVQDIALARVSLELPGVVVTADPVSRARGELGTASVIDRDAVANQTASSLASVLELVPGVPLQPPGLDNVQQFPLRAVPTSSSPSITAGGPSAADLASFGTLIVLDGVPVSNNANLQSTGPRGELQFLIPSSAGGGIDLRRIPATTIERVEVIRGVPSARYGDLTQGAVVVDTRAGHVDPVSAGKFDARTLEGSVVAGRELSGGVQALTATLDVSRTRIQPGLRDDDAVRISTQLAHRAALGRDPQDVIAEPKLALDSRVDFFRVRQNSPEQPEVFPGRASWNRDAGLRISERARLALKDRTYLEFTGSLDYTRQRSYVQSLRTRPAMPFTDRVDEGRATGRYIGGQYLSRLWLDGDAWHLYSRIEADRSVQTLGFDHRLHAGLELRREWNSGPGFRFDLEFPPQVSFNGVQGFDRPRRFDAIPPLATSGLYADDRLVRAVTGDMTLDVQAGVRLDLLHSGTTWISGVRDAVVQPRVNVQLAPVSRVRLRAGVGRTAKVPTLSQLYPAPQYFDVVNVNWFTNNPAERLAVLTTFVEDPTNGDLGFSTARKMEAGVEVELARGSAMSLVVFSDRTTGGVGFAQDPGFLLRDRFDFVDSTTGTGRPPELIDPPAHADTVPILVDRPANNLTLSGEGIELTATLPELAPLRTRLQVQGAWVKTEFRKSGIDFGRTFNAFQLDERIPRAPYWDNPVRTGERGIITYRLIHHQPRLGLVVTATIQHIFKEVTVDVGGTDSLAFAGYITRAGELVPVPAERRGDSEFEDLRVPRLDIFVQPTETPPDWLLSVQASKTIPLDGELRFYAFNALDRLGRFSEAGFNPRQFPPIRFGLELTLPLGRW